MSRILRRIGSRQMSSISPRCVYGGHPIFVRDSTPSSFDSFADIKSPKKLSRFTSGTIGIAHSPREGPFVGKVLFSTAWHVVKKAVDHHHRLYVFGYEQLAIDSPKFYPKYIPIEASVVSKDVDEDLCILEVDNPSILKTDFVESIGEVCVAPSDIPQCDTRPGIAGEIVGQVCGPQEITFLGDIPWNDNQPLIQSAYYHACQHMPLARSDLVVYCDRLNDTGSQVTFGGDSGCPVVGRVGDTRFLAGSHSMLFQYPNDLAMLAQFFTSLISGVTGKGDNKSASPAPPYSFYSAGTHLQDIQALFGYESKCERVSSMWRDSFRLQDSRAAGDFNTQSAIVYGYAAEDVDGLSASAASRFAMSLEEYRNYVRTQARTEGVFTIEPRTQTGTVSVGGNKLFVDAQIGHTVGYAQEDVDGVDATTSAMSEEQRREWQRDRDGDQMPSSTP